MGFVGAGRHKNRRNVPTKTYCTYCVRPPFLVAIFITAASAKQSKVSTMRSWVTKQSGKIGYAVAWLLGVPIPILVLVYLVRGCN